MKIDRVKAYGVAFPLTAIFKTAVMTYTKVEAVVTEVTTDDGHVGIGQATISKAPYSAYGETLSGAVHNINEIFGPALIGMDPLALEMAHQRMDSRLSANPFAKTAVDIALHDLIGKALGVPVYSLLGGPVVTELPLVFAIGQFPVEQLVEKAIAGFEQGYRRLKIRVGIGLETDMANLSALRKKFGNDVYISVDFNASMTEEHKRPDQAIRYVRCLEEFNLDTIEQPVAGWDIETMAYICEHVDTPLVADESVWSIHDAMRVIRRRAADVIKIKLIKTGGIHNACKIANMCEAVGMPLVVGHGVAGAIQNYAEAHFAAAMPNWKPPGEMNGFLKLQRDIAPPPVIKDGNIVLSDAPGLGFSLNDLDLERLKVA